MERTNIRVLLIADRVAKTSDIKDFLQQCMSPSFLVHQYDSVQEAMGFLVESRGGIDIIMLDTGTVDHENAEKVFHSVLALVADVPVIILTGATEHDLAMLHVKNGASDTITRETFRTSPEKLKDAIEFALSRNDILRKRTGINPGLQQTGADALMESAASAAAESRYADGQPLSHAESPPRRGIWLNGGYYVSPPQAASIKSGHKNKVLVSEAGQKIVFRLQGKINGGGTIPSMQLMPYKPTRGPKP